MGITIHLQGRLLAPGKLGRLVDEVSDIAGTLRWDYETIDHENLRGIFLTPPDDCETLALVFDREGVLRSSIVPREECSGWVAVKTQFASVDVHICLINLIRHLKKRYFAHLEVRDEGEYWETGERERLVAVRRRLGAATISSQQHPGAAQEQVSDAFSDAPTRRLDAKTASLVARFEEAIAEFDADLAEDGVDVDGDGAEEDDLKSLLRQPELPDEEVLQAWGVADWKDHFDKHDRGRSTILHAMADREETPEAFAEAVKIAEEEEKRHQRATRNFFRREMREQIRRIQEDPEPDEDFEADGFADDGDGDAPWRESLPSYVSSPGRADYDQAFAEIVAECPAAEEAHDFVLEVHNRLRDQKDPPAVVDYICACMTTTVVGVNMGRYWSKEHGFLVAQTARYALAADRFATVARLLRRFSIAGLEGLADRARAISTGFRTAASNGPGGDGPS